MCRSKWGVVMKYAASNIALGIAIGASLLGSHALAADLGVKAVAPPPPVAVFSWTGLYFGGNVGGHWGSDKLTTATSDPSGFFAPGGAAAIDGASPTTLKPGSFAGGFQGGYNWQFGQYVAGIEGDFDWLITSSTRTLTGIPVVNPLDIETNSDRPTYLATVRPRLGMVLLDPRLLIYATGGVAIGRITTNDAYSATAGTNLAAIGISKTLTGWTAGGGVEYAFASNWSVKGEYLYADLGSFTATAPAFVGTATTIAYTHKYTENLARVGVNYHFPY
ncbi:MAG: porin family protein [Xanthobacteraceae bacterium]|nr:porin family protein [Xanthobacteraceae bacterium]